MKDCNLDDEIESCEPDFTDGNRELWEHYRFEADKGQDLLRVDKFLVARISGTSRNRVQQAADAVALVEGTGNVEVKIVWEPAWTFERMSDEAKMMFEMF